MCRMMGAGVERVPTPLGLQTFSEPGALATGSPFPSLTLRARRRLATTENRQWK